MATIDATDRGAGARDDGATRRRTMTDARRSRRLRRDGNRARARERHGEVLRRHREIGEGCVEIDDDGGGGETRGREDGLREDRGDAREGDDARGARTTKD